MPDRDSEASPNARLITVLLWAGVGLAPVAALVVLLGGGETSMRFAVVLVAVCVVLIGAALLIRNDPVLLQLDVEDHVEALRTELREEITASAHATGNRVRALQDEMTRMRAAGSPAMGLPPAAARATAAPPAARPVAGHSAGGLPAGGRAGVVAPVNEAGHSTGARAAAAVPAPAEGWLPDDDREAASAPPARPAVATASVVPGGHTAVARIPAVAATAPVTGSASVPPVGARAAGTAAVAAAPVPRQRATAVVPPPIGGAYQTGYVAEDDGEAADQPAFDGYGLGPSGSAWAERSGAAEYDAAEAAPPPEPRPSRRHAAPDTGTDLARYGLGPAAAPPATTYGTAGAGYGHDETGDATWTGTGDYEYADPTAPDHQAPSAFGIETSSFFADEEVPAQENDYEQPPDRYASNGYGPDPMGPHHGWAPRSQEHPGRW